MKTKLMVRSIFILSYLILFTSFQSCTNETNKFQNKIDSLQTQIDSIKNFYKPGLGELMSTIQLHHEKLWFAGINKNWKLADFEIGEINETFNSAQIIETDRPEVKDIPMIIPILDSLSNSIKSNNIKAFKDNFKVMTAACNECHKINHFGFNIIKIPSVEPVVDQEFKSEK